MKTLLALLLLIPSLSWGLTFKDGKQVDDKNSINSLLIEINENETEIRLKEHASLIPSKVKAEVWARDKGKCVECESADHLHFDHILPYSKGGTSESAENIQLLCARHNLQKSDKII